MNGRKILSMRDEKGFISLDLKDIQSSGIYIIKLIDNKGNFGLKVLKDKINVYPNPAKNEITLNWSTKNNFSGIIKVLDIKGNVLTTKSIELKEGENSESIRLDNLPTGTYFIEAQRGQLKKTVKFMKN